MITDYERECWGVERIDTITTEGDGSGIACFDNGETCFITHQGQDIYFMVIPDPDSEVEHVTNSTGEWVFAPRPSDELYSFKQPLEDVQIVVTFRKKNGDQE